MSLDPGSLQGECLFLVDDQSQGHSERKPLAKVVLFPFRCVLSHGNIENLALISVSLQWQLLTWEGAMAIGEGQEGWLFSHPCLG